MKSLIAIMLITIACAAAQSPSLVLNYSKPPEYRDLKPSKEYMDTARGFPHSDVMREGLPIGNGRLGAMIMGDPLNERIQFNEISLWSGGANESGKYNTNEPGEFGTYQSFGDLFIRMKGIDKYDGYSRSLDLATGIHTTTWISNEVTYKREVFCSHPDEVIVIRITADKTQMIHVELELKNSRDDESVWQSGLWFRGELSNGLKYSAYADIEKGMMKPIEGTEKVQVVGDTELTIYLSATTNYAMDPTKGFRAEMEKAKKRDNINTLPVGKTRKLVNEAVGKKYTEIKEAHLSDFAGIMRRVELNIGAAPADLDIPQRLKRYREGEEDPHLEMLLFQYGRYLLASSSRHSLPANLQGLWNDSNHPAWFCDYHTNINIQMNYWPVEVANLSECALPLFNWIESSIPGSKAATRRSFGEDVPGWTMRTSVNIYGGNGWDWNLPASAWFCLHYWEHYAFTGDEAFLRERAWPIFKEVSEFWLHMLVEKDGKLMVPNGQSPEHGPREDGIAHDQQIVHSLFTHTLGSAEVLGIEDEFVKRVREALGQLAGPSIGSWGQLMEWQTERPTLEKSQHRHTSHLFALYPGSQITTHRTGNLARAAQISLSARGNGGDSRRSWTWAWRCALWARLGMPSQASDMIRGQLTWNTLPNLLATHPPFQFDGNAGITAGMCEMFVQSHDGEIHVMPAISMKRKWREGSFSGLKARGGFVVGGSWKGRAVASASIESLLGNPVKLRLPNIAPETITVTPSQGEAFKSDRGKDGTYDFKTKPGVRYAISWEVLEKKVDR